MYKVFSLILTSIFLFVVSQQAIVIMNFKLNQKAITEQFCINKAKPELQCNGKCHLTKELQETEHTDSEKIMNTKNFDLVYYQDSEFKISNFNITQIKVKLIYIEFQHSEPYLEVLKPPPLLNETLTSVEYKTIQLLINNYKNETS
ncbi:hypothetical protein [Winogradskyella sediminis]|uniref:Uncharacterized protein n=1 Tax=Winogradskyella sediminis TaxID=1382466 RepID=A0A1H1VRJ6_9FLAO|nr:hypothetical protein [Winogradskyella sediminis]REG87792.1 hypothetical protein C8N41_102638 [Winogradskyella sediminis]SDS86866.1 hypothetical protein SAMN04489797_2624 [Winogradskyella sediminis]